MKIDPIRDLAPIEKEEAVKELGGITSSEIADLSSSVRTTRNLTTQIVELFKRKNSSLKNDIATITKLDDQLKRSIPFIPGRAGIAGNLYGGADVSAGTSPAPIIPPDFPDQPPPTPPTPSPKPSPSPAPVPEAEKVPEVEIPVPETTPVPRRERPGFQWPDIEFPGIPAIPPLIPRLPDFASITKVGGEVTKLYKNFGDQAFALTSDFLQGKLPFQKELQARTPFLKPVEEFINSPSSMAIGLTGGAAALTGTAAVAKQLQTASGLSGAVKPVAPIARPAATTAAAVKPPTVSTPVAPLTRGTPRPSPGVYEEIAGSLPAPGAGGRLGGERVVTELPRTTMPGAFRRGPAMTQEERAMREVLSQMGIEKEIARISDPANLYSQLARQAVESDVRRADKIFDRIVGGGTKITKKPISSERLFGPNRYSAEQIQSAVDILKTGQSKGVSQPGSVGSYMQLDHPEVREGFLNYLLGAKNTKEGVANYGFFEKVMRQTGLLGDAPTQMDDDVFRFLMNYHKKVNLDPGPLIKQLNENNLIDPSTLINYKDRINVIMDGAKSSPMVEPLIVPKGPQSSIMPSPMSMDIASLGIDTSVEIQEIIYIVNA